MKFKIESASMSNPIIKTYPILKDFNFKQNQNEGMKEVLKLILSKN